jgi:hypothetical protein
MMILLLNDDFFNDGKCKNKLVVIKMKEIGCQRKY